MNNGFFEEEDFKKKSAIIMMIIVLVAGSLIFCSCSTSKQASVVSIRLDGTKSYDPDGYIVKWLWRQISGPEVIIKNISSDTTIAVINKEASYTFELKVTDDKGATGKDTVTVEYTKNSHAFF